MIRDENYELKSIPDSEELMCSQKGIINVNGKFYYIIMDSNSFQNKDYEPINCLISEITEEKANDIKNHNGWYDNDLGYYPDWEWMQTQFEYDILDNKSLRLVKIEDNIILEAMIVSIDEVIYFFPSKDPIFFEAFYQTMKSLSELTYRSLCRPWEEVYSEMKESKLSWEEDRKMKFLNLIPWSSEEEKKTYIKNMNMPESDFLYYCKDQGMLLDLMPWSNL